MSRRTMFAALLALVIAAPAALAQQQPSTPGNNNNQGDRGNRGGDRGNRGGGGFDPARFTDMIKERMAAPDEEWKVIEPKLTKVTEARRETMGSMFGGFRRRGSDSNSSDTKRSATEQASGELRDILDKKEATADEINAKLTAFREARDKARQALASAQKELKDVLTPRQEAVLVSMGMLD